MRIAGGFAVAALVGIVIYFVTMPFVACIEPKYDHWYNAFLLSGIRCYSPAVFVGMFFAGILSPIAIPILIGLYAITVMLGMPLLLAFKRRHWLSYWKVSLALGFLGGLCSMYSTRDEQLSFLYFLHNAPGFLSGLFSGMSFWLFAIWRNALLDGAAKADRGSNSGVVDGAG